MISIWAPHGDDEIIGCWSLLRQPTSERGPVDVYFGEMPAGEERSRLRRAFDVTIIPLESAIGSWDIVFAPDPADDHPLHQEMGQRAQHLFRRGDINRLVMYSTRMNVPYVFALDGIDAELKRGALEHCYPNKADLWRYEHKYFLFSGFCEWHRPTWHV